MQGKPANQGALRFKSNNHALFLQKMRCNFGQQPAHAGAVQPDGKCDEDEREHHKHPQNSTALAGCGGGHVLFLTQDEATLPSCQTEIKHPQWKFGPKKREARRDQISA
jgi:hypothetical protein